MKASVGTQAQVGTRATTSVRNPAAVVFTVAILAVVGCEFFRPELQNPSPVESRAFEDIPVPSDFQLNRDSRSGYSYSDGALRTGQLEYKGTVPARDVVDFYHFQMPLAGWTPRVAFDPANPTPSTPVDQPVELEFTKGRYLARIRIAESPATAWKPFSTTILVTLETD